MLNSACRSSGETEYVTQDKGKSYVNSVVCSLSSFIVPEKYSLFSPL